MNNTIRNRAIAAALALCVSLSGYVYSQRSILNLQETRVEMQTVAECAIRITPIDFVIVDGGRTAAEHKINVANGKSWTTRSRHQDGAAIDFAAYVNKRITYEPQYYPPIAEAFNKCSRQLGIPIVWGGEWRVKDLMHIELDRKRYP